MRPRKSFRFGPFVINPGERTLLREGVPIPILPKTFDLLLVLVESHGELLSKRELLQRVWPGVFVQENNLTVHMSALRKALGDEAHGSAFIETVPKGGYRFVVPVEAAEAVGPVPLVTGPGISRPSALLALVAAVAILAMASWLLLNRERSMQQPRPPAINSIVVLPFTNLSGATTQDYIAEAVTDSLTTDLAQFRSLRVISRTTAMKYAANKKMISEIARELKVDAIVEGSITQSGTAIRVNVQLIDASDRHVWASAYEDRNANVLALERDMAGQIAAEIQAHLAPQERDRIAQRYPRNPEAYRQYQQARFFWNKREEQALNRSIAHFQAAIEADPDFALAYSGLADAYAVQPEFASVSPLEVLPKAKAAAARALALDPQLGEAHCSLAYILWGFDWNYSEAEREFQRGLLLSPNYATGHQWYGQFLLAMRRFDEGEREIQKALELDPLSMVINLVAIYPPLYRHDYAEAERRAVHELEMYPEFGVGDLGEIYFLQGRDTRSDSSWKKLVASDPQEWIHSGAGLDERLLRHRIASENRASDASDDARTEYRMAVLDSLLGRRQAAITELRKLRDQHFLWLTYINAEPVFDPLRSDPGFAELVRSIHLGPSAAPAGPIARK